MATFKKWTSTVLVNGQPEPNVRIFVFSPGTTDQIPIYEDEGVTQITQPILTDSQGRYAFFVDVDAYPEIRLYLEKDGVDFSEVNEDLDGVPVPGAGGGAGTFTELTDTPSSYVGRGGDVVVVKNTEDGIETQPWPVTGTVLNVFLSSDAADIGDYYYMYHTETGDTHSEFTSPSLSTGNDQLLWSFVTEAGQPGLNQLALGAYTATLFLKKSGNKDVRVYWKLFKRDTSGNETEILESAVSDHLTTDNSQYLISAYLNEDQVLDPTDRLVFKLYANVSGTGTDVTVTLTMEGDYDSRLTINVLSSAFDLDRLSDVTITSPGNDELLAYDSGSGKWVNQTPGEAGVLAADGSVPLTGDLDFNFYSALNLKSVMGVVDVTTFPGSDLGAKINAAYAAGYKVLYIPPGNYTIAEGNEVVFSDDNGIVLQGAGKYATIITYEGSGTALTFSKTKFNTISGFMLKGNDLGSNGIKFDGMWMSHVSDIWVRSFTNKGIELTTPDTFGSYWNEFEQVFVDNCLYNLYLDSVEGGAGINANVFLGCKITDAKSGASATNIYLGSTGGGANENVFILPDISAASGIGIDNNGHSNIFIHPYVENCGSIGFRNNGQYAIIIGASFEGNAQNSDWIISPTVFLYKYDTVIRPDMIATSAGPIKAVKSCPYGSGIGDIFYFGIANETAVDNGKPYQFKIRLDGNNYGHDAILTKIKRGGATEDVLKLSRAGRIEMLQPLKLGTSAPSTPVEGDMYWDATNHVLKVYDGTEWKTLAWAT